MTIIELLQWMLLLFGAAVLATWIAYQSTIVQKIKKLLWLCEDQTLPKWKTWFEPIGIAFESFRDLINCPYCTGYHFGWMITYWITGMTLMQSLIYGAIVIVFVDVYRKLTL